MAKVYVLTEEQMQDATATLCAMSKTLQDPHDKRACTKVQDLLMRAETVRLDEVRKSLDWVSKLLKGGAT